MSEHGIPKVGSSLRVMVACVATLSAVVSLHTVTADAQSALQLVQTIPPIQQPWSFDLTGGIHQGAAIDSQGFVYVTDSGFERVGRFTRDGRLIRWITALDLVDYGGVAFVPTGVAVDANDNVYIASTNGTVHMLDENATLIAETILPTFGMSTPVPQDVAIGPDQKIYVSTQTPNNQMMRFRFDRFEENFVFEDRITYFDDIRAVDVDSSGNVFLLTQAGTRKYDATLTFQSQFGVAGRDLVVASDDTVYVNDITNTAILQYDGATGALLSQSNTSLGPGFHEVDNVRGFTIDSDGIAYLVEVGNKRVQKALLGPSLKTLSFWGSALDQAGRFDVPSGADTGFSLLYVSDLMNSRVQALLDDGSQLFEWAVAFPTGISVDGSGAFVNHDTIYVLKSESVEVYENTNNTPGGILLRTTINPGFAEVGDVAVVNSGGETHIYITETADEEIHYYRRTDATTFVPDTVLSSFGAGDSFNGLPGLGIDPNGFLLAVDRGNDRVVRFPFDLSSSEVLTGAGVTGGFQNMGDVDADNSGNIFVLDQLGNRVSRFSSALSYLDEFTLPLGSFPGQINGASSFEIRGTSATIVDGGNNRIAEYEIVSAVTDSKAVIVAAGGPYTGNNLWFATEELANHAYRTLVARGYNKTNIRYLSSSANLDPDNDGVPDVFGPVTSATIQTALEDWVPVGGPDQVVLYMVNHGGVDEFRLSADEELSASTLGGYINTMESNLASASTPVVIVYDACNSGSFIDDLQDMTQKQAVLASAGAAENAHFISDGAVGFSSFFWTNIYQGDDVVTAFTESASALTSTAVVQTPVSHLNDIDAGSFKVFIGNDVINSNGPPVISMGAAVETAANTATISADIADAGKGIARAWALIRSPGFSLPSTSSDNPIQSFAEIDLQPTGMGTAFDASWDGFRIDAQPYAIAIYAQDSFGNIGGPEITSVTMGTSTPETHRAVILVSGVTTHPDASAHREMGNRAYDALTRQGVLPADIEYMSPYADTGVDNPPTYTNLEDALLGTSNPDGYDSIVYLVGPTNGADFQISGAEIVDNGDFSGFLNELQNLTTGIAGPVTVVLDFDYSGDWIPDLAGAPGGRTRVLIAGSSGAQQASFAGGGFLSFSNVFWIRILNGHDVRSAFQDAAFAMRSSPFDQTPVMDDDGDGNVNEPSEGRVARGVSIGAAIRLAGESPTATAENISAPTTVATNNASISVQGIATTGTIAAVRATVLPPWPTFTRERACFDLTDGNMDGIWTGDIQGMPVYGPYTIEITVEDTLGLVSSPISTTIIRLDGTNQDPYESDDTTGTANSITPGEPAQTHNFHVGGDIDFVKFEAEMGENIVIRTFNLGSTANTSVTVLRADFSELTSSSTVVSGRVDEFVAPTYPATETYYVKVENTGTEGQDSHYDLFVGTEEAPILPNGALGGVVTTDGHEELPTTDLSEGFSFELVRTGGTETVEHNYTTHNNLNINFPRFYSFLQLVPASYTVTISKLGFEIVELFRQTQNATTDEFVYTPTTSTFSISGTEAVIINAQVQPTAEHLRDNFDQFDLNGDGFISGPESLLSTGFNSIDDAGVDDGKLSMEELLMATGFTDVGSTPEVWVRFNYTGTELGTMAQPLNSMAEGLALVSTGGTLHLRHTSSFTGTLSKPVTITAFNGSATLGAP